MSEGKQAFLCVLFGLGLLAMVIGWLGVDVWRTLATARRMKSWEEVPATISSTELKVRQDKSATYCAIASFRYTCDGKVYEGDRVSLHSGPDNIGPFQRRVYAELSQYQQAGKPFRCYVNPENPAESILYRVPRWEMIGFNLMFVFVFGVIGLVLVMAGAWTWITTRHDKARKAFQPDKPWTRNREWAQGVIPSSNRMVMGSVSGLAAFWNVISVPVSVMVIGDVASRRAGPLALLVLIYQGAGLALAVWAIRRIMSWRKFGESRFEMASVPGIVGGRLGGVVCVPAHIQPEDGFHLKLSCIHSVTTGSGKSRRTIETVAWQDTRVMKRELWERDRSKSAIPVLFGIPYECRSTDDSDSDDTIQWRLDVKVAVPGIDYHVTFDVPVFRTEASSPDFKLDESAIAPYVAAAGPGD